MKLSITTLPILAGALMLALPHAMPPRSIARLHIDPTQPRVTHVLVYSTGNGAFAPGSDSVRSRRDTLRLATPVNVTADLTDGDLHIVAVEESDLDLTGTLLDAPASKLSAIGRHLVIERGGTGVSFERR